MRFCFSSHLEPLETQNFRNSRIKWLLIVLSDIRHILALHLVIFFGPHRAWILLLLSKGSFIVFNQGLQYVLFLVERLTRACWSFSITQVLQWHVVHLHTWRKF